MANKQTTELTVQESKELALNPAYQTMKMFELQQRMAQMYVQSTIVPDTYRGNIGNCAIAIDMAQRMHANPLMVMQNLYIVHGQPSWSSKFLIACINSSGRFTPLRYQFFGKRGTMQYACRAYAYEKSDREHKDALCGIWVTMEMAQKEGWMSKNGSKWATMPDQMLVYRAAAFWQRAYAPEISMGFYTKEELEDAVVVEEIVTPTAPATDEEPAPAIDDAPVMDNEPVTADANLSAAPTTDTEQQAAGNAAPSAAPAASIADNAKAAVAEAMQRQTRKTNYRAPQTQDAAQNDAAPASVDPETGELFGGNVIQ